MEAPSRVGYSLGTYGDPPSINLLIEIDEDEFRSVRRSLAAISRLETPFSFKLVERNLLDLKSIHQFATIVLSLGRTFARTDHRMLGEAVMTSVVNWLTSVRLFLDHEETTLKQTYGKGSPAALMFKEATARSFDDRVGYRFTAKLRNYVQHCGLPLSQISISENREGGMAKQRARLLLNRNDLLQSYKEWGPVKPDL